VDTCADWLDDARRFLTETLPEYGRKAWDAVNRAWDTAKDYTVTILDNVKDFFSDVDNAVKDWWEEHFGKKEQSGGSSSGSACRIKVDTQYLQQAATRMGNIAYDLQELENAVSRCARSLQGFSFASTVAIKASLMATQLKIKGLGNAAEDMSKALTNVAGLYDKSENQQRTYVRAVLCAARGDADESRRLASSLDDFLKERGYGRLSGPGLQL
jgi:hypothetical protein